MKQFFLAITFLILLFAFKDKSLIFSEQIYSPKNIKISTSISSQPGIDSLLFDQLTTKIENQEYPNIHSLLIAKNGNLLYERYFTGNDQNYGHDIGSIIHTDTTLHDLRSITKSVVSACIGIAIDKGLIKSVDQKIADFFPEITFENEKATWTIVHFLSMTTGLVWNEKVPYNNPKNDEIQMTYSKDPVQYVLNKPLEAIPGTKFNYSGGATQVLAEIIERSSKTSLDQFANNHLFGPLGIKKFEWNKFSIYGGADDFAAPSGLRLTSRDLLNIGLLYRNKGKCNNQQILSEEWVEQSFTQKVEFPSDYSESNDSYGYQFWMWPDVILNYDIWIIAAIGNGGQNIFWDLKNDIIVVTTAGNYNQWDIKNDPYALLKNEIYPLFLRR